MCRRCCLPTCVVAIVSFLFSSCAAPSFVASDPLRGAPLLVTGPLWCALWMGGFVSPPRCPPCLGCVWAVSWLCTVYGKVCPVRWCVMCSEPCEVRRCRCVSSCVGVAGVVVPEYVRWRSCVARIRRGGKLATNTCGTSAGNRRPCPPSPPPDHHDDGHGGHGSHRKHRRDERITYPPPMDTAASRHGRYLPAAAAPSSNP